MARRPSVIGPPSTHKLLGALPVVAGFARRLDIAGIIDRACPIRGLATLSHGQVIEVLIANRLTSPSPLVHVADWAAAWAVSEVVGPDPDTLSTTTGSAGPRTLLRRSWNRSSARSGSAQSPRSGSTCPGCTRSEER